MTETPERTHWIGFDLGGTKMLAQVYDAEFRPIGRKRRKTKGFEGMTIGLERMVKTIKDACADAGIETSSIAGIGVGCPGPLDLDAGVVLETPNLGWRNVPVKATLEAEFDAPTVISNDVDAGVFGEYRFGAARDARTVIGIFPGTGIGGGCVYEGKIFRGATGSCMEIGHFPVVDDGPLCGCGQRGCLEAVASRLAVASEAARAAYRGEAPHLLSIAGTDLSEIRSKALAESIKCGDTAVEEIMRRAARRVGKAVGGIANLLAPDVVLLGGGLVEDTPAIWLEEVEKTAKNRAMPAYRGFKVVEAELGGEAGVKGAAAWARAVVEG